MNKLIKEKRCLLCGTQLHIIGYGLHYCWRCEKFFKISKGHVAEIYYTRDGRVLQV